MPDDDRLDDLLLRWEEQHDQGQDVSPEELCRDCPGFVAEVRERIAELMRVGWLSEKEPEAGRRAKPPQARVATRHPGHEPIPGYKLIQLIGKGGVGEVWAAEARGALLKAIKFVPGGMGENKEYDGLNRIKEIRHPFLLSVERIEATDDGLVIVSELADESLHDCFGRLREKWGPHPFPHPVVMLNCVRLLADAAEALDHINANYRLQHLDVKPTNLLMVGPSHCKLSDFGTITMLGGLGPGWARGGFTMKYAAPEVIEGRCTDTSDQYSLAMTFCELTTGRLPFTGEIEAQLAQRSKGEFDLEFLPQRLRPAIRRALSPAPGQRFSSCKAFVEAVTRGLREEGERQQRVETECDPGGPSDTKGTIPLVADHLVPRPDSTPWRAADLSEVRLRIAVLKGRVVTALSWSPPIPLTDFERRDSDCPAENRDQMPGSMWDLALGREVIVGRQDGGRIEYLDPRYQSTPLIPGRASSSQSAPTTDPDRSILRSPNDDRDPDDGFVSRAHFMLVGSRKGIVLVNGVPGRDGGIRSPMNGTKLLEPFKRWLDKGEEYLVRRGESVTVELPNGTVLMISAR